MAGTTARLTQRDRALLRGKNFAHLATIMPDGSPQVTPVWVDERDGLILVNTATGRAKPRNVDRDPRVALSVCDAENPYVMTAVRGRVVRVTEEGAEDHIDALSQRYNGRDYPAHGGRVILEIEPQHIARMGHAAEDGE